MIYEVFRQERKGQPFTHAGSVEAPNDEYADSYAREQFELVQEALNRWWGPLMQFHGNPIPPDEDPMFQWRIKSQGNDEARQQFLDGYVPQIWELGLTVPDPELRKDEETGRWHYTEPDWDELMSVVTGHGPKTEDRLDLRRQARENSAWIRQVVLAEAA